MARAAVLLADGFEETEAVAVIDVLRRADIRVDVLGVSGKRAKGSHDIVIEADALLADKSADRYQLVVLPGGMPGAARLRDDAGVQAFVKAHHAAKALVTAICAAPIALAAAGVLAGKRATCFPGFEAQLRDGGAHVADAGASGAAESVVRDGNVITSRGVGTALAFALALVAAVKDEKTARVLAERMLVGA
jgi:4-methyl-5(b-hydroxyethyl)-thiazole monophosphate biosynthesis